MKTAPNANPSKPIDTDIVTSVVLVLWKSEASCGRQGEIIAVERGLIAEAESARLIHRFVA